MSLPSPEDVMSGLRTRWSASTANDLIAVERVYLGRTAERTDFPRVRVKIVGTNKEFYGTKALCRFSITIEAYFTAAIATRVRSEIETVMSYSKNFDAFGWPMTNGTMIWVRPGSGEITEPTGQRVDGNDIVRVTSEWVALADGYRELNN